MQVRYVYSSVNAWKSSSLGSFIELSVVNLKQRKKKKIYIYMFVNYLKWIFSFSQAYALHSLFLLDEWITTRVIQWLYRRCTEVRQ